MNFSKQRLPIEEARQINMMDYPSELLHQLSNVFSFQQQLMKSPDQLKESDENKIKYELNGKEWSPKDIIMFDNAREHEDIRLYLDRIRSDKITAVMHFLLAINTKMKPLT